MHCTCTSSPTSTELYPSLAHSIAHTDLAFFRETLDATVPGEVQL